MSNSGQDMAAPALPAEGLRKFYGPMEDFNLASPLITRDNVSVFYFEAPPY